MSEISIKIKGPISKVRNTKTKKKAKARTTKPKTKTENYLEKLKGREYSYNVSPFYDYKSSLQPTYIYRQQTIPQLQQDSKNSDLIKYLEDLKKSDRELQTLKFRNTDPPTPPHFPEHLLNQPKQERKTTSSVIAKDVTESEAIKEQLEKYTKQNQRYNQLIKEIEDMEEKIKPEKTKYNKAIDREIKGLKYEGNPSSVYQTRINIFETEIAKKELEKNILKRDLGIK